MTRGGLSSSWPSCGPAGRRQGLEVCPLTADGTHMGRPAFRPFGVCDHVVSITASLHPGSQENLVDQGRGGNGQTWPRVGLWIRADLEPEAQGYVKSLWTCQGPFRWSVSGATWGELGLPSASVLHGQPAFLGLMERTVDVLLAQCNGSFSQNKPFPSDPRPLTSSCRCELGQPRPGSAWPSSPPRPCLRSPWPFRLLAVLLGTKQRVWL